MTCSKNGSSLCRGFDEGCGHKEFLKGKGVQVIKASDVQLPADLVSAGNAVLTANFNYRAAWFKFFDGVKPVSKARFWALLECFRKEVEVYCFTYKRTNGVGQAAKEFFRKALVGSMSAIPGCPTYSIQEASGFVKAYSKALEVLERRHGKLFDYAGDSFGDLMDSLPLAGSEFFEKRFATEDELYGAIRSLEPVWSEFLFRENYVLMSLEDAAKHYVLAVIRYSMSTEY